MSVKVKICGVTEPANALLAVEQGADFLGLNFYSGSPRFVETTRAREIAAAVAGRVPLVGVFVNAAPAEIEEIVESVGLSLVQGSGDESPEDLRRFAGRSIKAFRTGRLPDRREIDIFGDLWAVLIDAPHDSLFGGTGETWDYAAVGTEVPHRLFLAGGLGPDNVRRVVETVRPWGIDVCSRVESAPGIKDGELLRRLFLEVRHGETQTPS